VTVIRCINNADINATEHYVGGLFGHLEGNYTKTASWEPEYISSIKITDCRNRADVSGKDYVGGILGISPAYVGEISFCENLGDVTGNMYVGGYVGASSGTLLKGLCNTNTITGRAYLGGIAGSAGKLDSCENSGTIVPVQYYLDNSNTPLSYVGGIAGYANNVKSCINNSRIDVSYGGHYVGGIVGYLAATRLASETVSGNTNNGEITGTSYVGGIAGWMIVNVGNNNDFITVSNNKNCAPVSGSKNYVGGILGGAAGRFNQNASWDPQYFSYVKITDCHNEAYVSGNDYVGGILGYAPEYVSEIMLSTSIDDVTGNLYVGGFAGYASGTAMRNLKNSNTVTGKTYVGGIAGFAGKLDSCENNGVIVAVRYTLDSDNVALSYVGGIAGYATGATGCTNNSDINVSEGGRYVGGIAGYIHATRSLAENISYNANNGAVKGTSYVGGIAGCIKVKVGNNNDTVLVTENKNYANVTASGDFVGGLFGELAGTFNQGASWDPQYISHIRVTNCHNEANVKGNDYVGGIVGNCREYVEAEAVVWNTNIFLGTVTAVGSHKGDYYGSI
jgi:hypothetical protein